MFSQAIKSQASSKKQFISYRFVLHLLLYCLIECLLKALVLSSPSICSLATSQTSSQLKLLNQSELQKTVSDLTTKLNITQV